MQEPLQEYAECLRFRQDEITAAHGIGVRDVKTLLFLMTSMTESLCEFILVGRVRRPGGRSYMDFFSTRLPGSTSKDPDECFLRMNHPAMRDGCDWWSGSSRGRWSSHTVAEAERDRLTGWAEGGPSTGISVRILRLLRELLCRPALEPLRWRWRAPDGIVAALQEMVLKLG